MWLSRVELLNFKSYRQQVFTFPQPGSGKNLVLIGGINGYGKTTLLEALYVGLYGEEAFKHKALDSAGLKAKSYGSFLEVAFHRLAPNNGDDRMEVQVEFTREDGGALRVTRKWFFNGRGKYNDQKVIVETCAQTGAWMHRAEGELPELLESYATPPWLAPFFFFDGEKIAGLADEDRTGWVLSGLENLLGVKLVKELREQLTAYIDKKLREAGGVDEQRIEQMKNTLEKDKSKESALRESMAELRQRHGNAKDERDCFSNQLAGLAQGSDARTVAEVAQSRSRAEAEVAKSWKRLRDLYAGPLPLQLIRRELQDSLANTLEREDSLSESSGESQLFVLALVGALAEVTGYRVPMIIDTPLARLSETHCQNLLRYWTSDPEHQVILLAQDKEISAQDYVGLNGSVNKTYLLRHKQISQGVGQSEAVENAYFGEMA